jgi:hypothetical protein
MVTRRGPGIEVCGDRTTDDSSVRGNQAETGGPRSGAEERVSQRGEKKGAATSGVSSADSGTGSASIAATGAAGLFTMWQRTQE